MIIIPSAGQHADELVAQLRETYPDRAVRVHDGVIEIGEAQPSTASTIAADLVDKENG